MGAALCQVFRIKMVIQGCLHTPPYNGGKGILCQSGILIVFLNSLKISEDEDVIKFIFLQTVLLKETVNQTDMLFCQKCLMGR